MGKSLVCCFLTHGVDVICCVCFVCIIVITSDLSCTGALGGKSMFGVATITLMHLFTARRYASAVYAVVVCLSVRHKPVLCQNR